MKKTLVERINEGFVTKPNDRITIVEHKNMICDTIDIVLWNTGTTEKEHTCLPNNISAWKWLKMFNEIGGRAVLKEVDGELIPFEQSLPYLYRFDRAAYEKKGLFPPPAPVLQK